MTSRRLGRQTVALLRPPSVVSYANVGGKFEANGPLAEHFDLLCTDSFFGKDTWEQAESAMQQEALTRALEKSKLEKAAYSLILSLARVGLYLLLGLSLLVMLGVTIKERVSNPHLVTERPTAPQGMGQEQNLLASLMQKVAAEPTNKDALMHLAEHLMATQEWDAAATFAQRAVALDVNDPQPLYMLGVILHNQGKPQEAAATLEKVVALRDDATVRYSLGVLYSYFLQQKDKGRAHWEAGLKDPKISPEMRQAIEEELKK